MTRADHVGEDEFGNPITADGRRWLHPDVYYPEVRRCALAEQERAALRKVAEAARAIHKCCDICDDKYKALGEALAAVPEPGGG